MNDRLHSVNGYVVSCSALYYVSLLVDAVPLNGAFETVPRPHFSRTYVNAPLIPLWIHLPVSQSASIARTHRPFSLRYKSLIGIAR